MKTTITLEIEHSKPIPHLAQMIAGRAWSMDGVTHAEVIPNPEPDLLSDGFTPRELALGRIEVVRG